MVHITDIYTTLAKLGGAQIPTDRAVDGSDQSALLLGKTEQSAREWFPLFQTIGALGPRLYGMKWRNYKMHWIWQERMFDALAKFQASMKLDPPVPMGASDPYKPPAAR